MAVRSSEPNKWREDEGLYLDSGFQTNFRGTLGYLKGSGVRRINFSNRGFYYECQSKKQVSNKIKNQKVDEVV
jgi:hypothetical protein